jgi:ABC-type transport system involved in multi-copper enzyme maturation permease subunit
MKAIFYNTIIELFKNKIFYIMLFFSSLLTWILYFVSSLSIVWEQKIILDLWLWIIELFWLIIVLFVWSNLLYNEIEGKTIILLMSKPISSAKLILAKFFSFSLFLLTILSFNFLVFLSVYLLKWWMFSFDLVIAFLFIWFKFLITLSFLLLLWTIFAYPIITIIWTFSIYLVWNWIYYLTDATARTGLPYYYLYYILPNFEILNLKDKVSEWISILPSHLYTSSLYVLLYCSVLLFITIYLFKKKEF